METQKPQKKRLKMLVSNLRISPGASICVQAEGFFQAAITFLEQIVFFLDSGLSILTWVSFSAILPTGIGLLAVLTGVRLNLWFQFIVFNFNTFFWSPIRTYKNLTIRSWAFKLTGFLENTVQAVRALQGHPHRSASPQWLSKPNNLPQSRLLIDLKQYLAHLVFQAFIIFLS